MPDTTLPALEEIRERVEAATPEPWESAPAGYVPSVWADSIGAYIAIHVSSGEADAEFIGHARQDVPLLLALADEVLALHQRQENPCRSYGLDLRCAAHSGHIADWTAEGTKTLRESIRDCPDCTYRETHPCTHCRCEDWPCPTVQVIGRVLGQGKTSTEEESDRA